MKEKKTMLRRWWFNNAQCEQAEAWLNDLAAEGWQLVSIGSSFVKFRKCETGFFKYRCMNGLEGAPDAQELKEIYQQAGWSFINEIKDCLVFSAPMNTALPELHDKNTDTATEPKKPKVQILFGVGLLLVVLVSAVWFYLSLGDSKRLTDFLLERNFRLVSVFISLVVGLIYGIRFIYLISSKKCKTDNPAEEKTVYYQKTIRWSRIRYLAVLSLFILDISASALDTVSNHRLDNLPPGHYAVITISDMISTTTNTVSGNSKPEYIFNHSILFPEQLELVQDADVECVSIQEGKKYKPFIGYKSFRALTPWLARILAEQMVKTHFYFHYSDSQPLPADAHPLSASTDNKGSSGLWRTTYYNGLWHEIVAVQGNMVYYINYESDRTTDEIIDVLKERIAETK